MISEACCPLPVTVPVAAVQVVTFSEIEPLNRIAAILPVYQIVRFQNRNSGKNKHSSIDHVITGIRANYVRVREIGCYYRICVSSVSVIAAVFLGG